MSRDWDSALSRLQHLIDALERDLDDRDRLEDSNRSGQKPGRAARANLSKSLTYIDEVKAMVNGRGGRELTAQQRKELENSLDEQQERLNHMEDRYRDGPQYPDLDRDELLEGNDWAIGVEEDAEALGVEELLERQRQTMRDQDLGLDQLVQTLGNQRTVGQAIFDEVEEQNMLLDEVADDMGHAGSQARGLADSTRRLVASDQAKKACVLVGVVVALLVVLIIVIVI